MVGAAHREGVLCERIPHAIALFSAAVNPINASNALGTSSGLSLVDWIHIIVLIDILVAAPVAVSSRLLLDRGWTVADVTRLNYRLGAVARSRSN